jgi:arylsulfatase A-like enzyme
VSERVNEKKNILFILIDCLRSDRCSGDNRTCKTPTIDSLVKNGTFLSQAISSTSTTTPSVASILTGFYSFNHGIRSLFNYNLKKDIKSLAEILKENGYNTYAEVTGALFANSGLDRGFDHYNYRDHRTYVYSKWGDNLIRKFKNNDFKVPWFVFIHFLELHYPRQVLNEYDNKEFGKNNYDRALSSLDSKLGELLKDIDDNTLIILLSDHGEKISETMIDFFITKIRHRIWKLKKRMKITSDSFNVAGHGFHVYDDQIRVPLVFSCNDLFPKGKVISSQVRLVDVFPTILDVLKYAYDGKIDGQSLMDLINGEGIVEEPAYLEAVGIYLPKNKWLQGIRIPKYKFIQGMYSKKVPNELYDLENDPSERKNIIKEKPEIANELKQKLNSLIMGEDIEFSQERMSSEEEEKILDQLRQLGYIS